MDSEQRVHSDLIALVALIQLHTSAGQQNRTAPKDSEQAPATLKLVFGCRPNEGLPAS